MAATSTEHALDAVLDALCCPTCRQPLARDGRRLRCPAGHGVDLARQGYAPLFTGHQRHRGDDARMVAARERFLGAGHYRALSTALAELTAAHAPHGLAVDLAGGTGHHLAAVLGADPARPGLVVEASTPALRRAARAHPRIAAVGADVRAPLPLRDGVAAAVLSVFSPRPVAEIERVLGPGGALVLAHPAPEHLVELGDLVGTIGVDPRKPERLAASFGHLRRLGHRSVHGVLSLTPDEVADVVTMGPSAHHVDDAVFGSLPQAVELTVAVEVVALARP